MPCIVSGKSMSQMRYYNQLGALGWREVDTTELSPLNETLGNS